VSATLERLVPGSEQTRGRGDIIRFETSRLAPFSDNRLDNMTTKAAISGGLKLT
jgi:hypothetical protein